MISEVMAPGEFVCQPTAVLNVTAMGYVDGTLRGQVHYDRIMETDDHGAVCLVNECRVLTGDLMCDILIMLRMEHNKNIRRCRYVQ